MFSLGALPFRTLHMFIRKLAETLSSWAFYGDLLNKHEWNMDNHVEMWLDKQGMN